jgi:hypothetical protein
MDLRCAYCDKGGKLARDHVVPRSRGGPDNATNIVMACQSCNSSKGDSLPSEWMGDRCPAKVLLIEARVNAKLKSVFKQRDRKKGADPEPESPQLFALHLIAGDDVDYVGEVVSEGPTTIRVNVVNALSLMFGLWDVSGELLDLPRTECRLFTDRDACVMALDRINARKNREARA